MPEPLAEQAIVNLVEILSDLTGQRFWGGSYPNAPLVTREFKFPEQVTSCPVICVTAGSGSQIDTANAMETVGSQMQLTDRCVVTLTGHVINDLTTSATTWLLRLRHDMRQAIIANASLGGVVRSLVFGVEETDDGAVWPRAYIRMPITLVMDQVFTTD